MDNRGCGAYPYITITPTTTNTNLDVFALACKKAPDGGVLQIQLHTSDGNPLQPTHLQRQPFKKQARAAILIDRRLYHIFLLIADDYAVLADARDGLYPKLSSRLFGAMQTGTEMTLIFDLIEEGPGEAARFDSEAIIHLKSLGSLEAFSAARRCIEAPDHAHAAASSGKNEK